VVLIAAIITLTALSIFTPAIGIACLIFLIVGLGFHLNALDKNRANMHHLKPADTQVIKT
jgi:hypothetical protein